VVTPPAAGTPSSRLAAVRAVAAAVVDPEIPVLTIDDLGVLRDVVEGPAGIVVRITPTYSGCPAMQIIHDEIVAAVDRAGLGPVTVETVLAPAWTTDWMTERGRRALADYGIAPPAPGPARLTFFRTAPGICPRCGSTDTTEIAPFGSTACKALWRCEACREPFDVFKTH
jgi:ring-1,2-phenylacetyl-CoA epoxidase subunit PaaD